MTAGGRGVEAGGPGSVTCLNPYLDAEVELANGMCAIQTNSASYPQRDGK